MTKLREARGMKQTELARRLGVCRATVSAWEKGINQMRLSTAVKVAQILGCTVEELYSPE